MNHYYPIIRLSVLACGLSASMATAAIHTVDNRPGRAASFTSLATAISSALPGDTIYVMGSPTSYGDITLAKPLTIYGPGYFLGENQVPIAEANPAQIRQLNVNTGAAGSKFIGLQIGDRSSPIYDLNVHASSLLFQRCYVIHGIDMAFNNAVADVGFERCVLGRMDSDGDVVSLSGDVSPGVGYPATGITFSNCLIRYLEVNQTYSECTVDQCVLGGAELSNSTVRNSIFTSTYTLTFDGTTTITHCLRPGTLLPAGNGNINSANLDLVCIGWNSGTPPGAQATSDSWTRLVESPLNPARNAGTTGQDLGMYAGSFPYVPSGVPPLPRITSVIAPVVIPEGQALPIQVKGAGGE